MKAVIYARVSTATQKTDMQLDECRRFVKAQGWELEEYLETESSVKARPVLACMMDAARRRSFDVVVVWKLDRIARSMKQFIDIVLELDRYGVRFLSVTQRMIDSDQRDPMGVFLRNLFAALAELERGIIVERVKSGVAAAKARGKHCGRPSKVFARERAIELRQQGQSFRQVAKGVGVDARTIRRLLASAVPPEGGAKVRIKASKPVKQTKD